MAAASADADCDYSAVLRVLLRNRGVSAAAAFSEELDLPDGIEAQSAHAESYQLIIAAQARAAEAALLSWVAPVSKDLKVIADKEMPPAAREMASVNMNAALDTVWTMYMEANQRAKEAQVQKLAHAGLGESRCSLESMSDELRDLMLRMAHKEGAEEGDPMEFLSAEELKVNLRNIIQ